MTVVYLDTCAIQRPLDTRSHVRISIEAEAVIGIISACEAGSIRLVSSEALEFEVSRTPVPARREYAREVLRLASAHVKLDSSILAHARRLTNQGIKPLDALHLACADASGARSLCTCDDRFLRKAQAVRDLTVTVVNPVDLIGAVENGSDHQTTS